MPRLVIPLLLLLLFVPIASAVYSVNFGGFLYEVRYTAYSNGTTALINAEIDNYGVSCGMDSCWAEVYKVYDNLLYYNGSMLYLLNFTPALEASLPSYAPRNITYVHFNWVYYSNGSWYVNVSLSAYSPETVESFNKKYVYRLNLKNFCVEQTNVSLAEFPTKGMKETINGWKIVVPHEFRARMIFINGTWIKIDNETHSAPLILSADFFIGANASVFNSSYVRPWIRKYPHFAPNSSKLPIYFVLRKDAWVKNVTLFYINTTSGLNGFWFPDSVKIANVTLCKSTTTPGNTASNGTATQTATHGNVTLHNTSIAGKTTTIPTKGKKTICGPGFAVIAPLLALAFRRFRE